MLIIQILLSNTTAMCNNYYTLYLNLWRIIHLKFMNYSLFKAGKGI